MSFNLQKIGKQCVHVSAIWKFNDHLGKKAMHVSRMKDICDCLRNFRVSLWMLEG